MLVSEEQLEASLARLRSEARHPDAGLFGPGSPMWEVSRESLLLVMGGGRAALLQLAHPFVARAISEHSHTLTDIAGRFQRTFDNVFAMIFGSLPDALTSARRVHGIHQRIRGTIPDAVGSFESGTPYWANDPDALLWVAATLWETSIHVYEQFVRPLTADEKERYYADAHRFADLFGIPREILPPDWEAFMDYNQRMWESDVLTVSPDAERIAAAILSPPRPIMRRPMGWIRLMTAGLLPPNLREPFGLRYGRRERAAFRVSALAVRKAYPRLPGRLRYLPAYVDACRRLSGRRPSRTSALIERGMVQLIARPATA